MAFAPSHNMPKPAQTFLRNLALIAAIPAIFRTIPFDENMLK